MIFETGECSLVKLKYFQFGDSFLFDSLHTLYSGVFKKLCSLLFSKAREDRSQSWSLFKKINSIDKDLADVKIPTTRSRRFRTIKELDKFKANEFRSLFHHGSTVLLRSMKAKYRKHFSLLLSAVTIASKNKIDRDDVESVKNLLEKFVHDWQTIFGLRNMSSNVHSLLHLHESISYLGPLYMYTTFNFEGMSFT